jgi:hypothetical protein
MNEKITLFEKRVRLVRAWIGLAIGGIAGGAVAAVVAGLDWGGYLLVDWLILALIVLACAVLGALVGFFRPVSLSALADSIDRRAHLDNRLRTSLELEDGSFAEVQRADAAQHLEQVRPREIYPLRVTRWHGGWVAACVVASSIFLLGNTPLLLSPSERQEREELKKAGVTVERVARPILEERDAELVDEQELARRLERLAREMEKGRLSKQEALAKANELAKEADELAKKRFTEASEHVAQAETAFQKLMEQQLREQGLPMVDPQMMQMSDAQMQAQQQALEQQINDLQERLEQGEGLSEEQLKELQAKLAEAKEALKQFELSKKAKEFLEKLMNQPEYKELMEMMEKLRKEAEAGQQGQQQITEEQVKEMIRRLEELADQLKDDEAMREYLRQMMEALKKAQGG